MVAVVDIEEKGLDELIKEIGEMIARCDNLAPVAPAVLDDLLDQNRGIKLRKQHPLTVLEYKAPATFIVGSRRRGYGELINASPRFMLDIMIKYILDGDANG